VPGAQGLALECLNFGQGERLQSLFCLDVSQGDALALGDFRLVRKILTQRFFNVQGVDALPLDAVTVSAASSAGRQFLVDTG
jgi:hypothetical protein